MIVAASMFLDGIIQGVALAKNVNNIVDKAVMFGRDEARRADNFFARVQFTDLDDLKRDAVRITLDGLLDGTDTAKVIRDVTVMAIAFGFQAEKQNLKYADIDAALNKVLNEHKAGTVSDETINEYFGEVLKIEDEMVAINYVRKLITEHKVPMSTKLSNFNEFVEQYKDKILTRVFR